MLLHQSPRLGPSTASCTSTSSVIRRSTAARTHRTCDSRSQCLYLTSSYLYEGSSTVGTAYSSSRQCQEISAKQPFASRQAPGIRAQRVQLWSR